MEPLTLEQREAAVVRNTQLACKQHELKCRAMSLGAGVILGVFFATLTFIIFF